MALAADILCPCTLGEFEVLPASSVPEGRLTFETTVDGIRYRVTFSDTHCNVGPVSVII